MTLLRQGPNPNEMKMMTDRRIVVLLFATIFFVAACKSVSKKPDRQEAGCRFGIDHGQVSSSVLDSILDKKLVLTQMSLMPLSITEVDEEARKKYIHIYDDTSKYLLIKSRNDFQFEDQRGKWKLDSIGISFTSDNFCDLNVLNGVFKVVRLSDSNYMLEHNHYRNDTGYHCRFLFKTTK